MRIFLYVGVVVLAFFTLMAAIGQCQAGEKRDITNDRRVKVGDLYDPGHGRRIQIRDSRRRVIGYIERDGDITDTRRRKILEIELHKE